MNLGTLTQLDKSRAWKSRLARILFIGAYDGVTMLRFGGGLADIAPSFISGARL
jgi:hypothetical protein